MKYLCLIMKKYKPTKEELTELGFKYNVDIEHYVLEITEKDIYGFKFPCLVNYFSDHNIFLMGAAFYFSPDSVEDLKTIIKVFGENVNNYKAQYENC